MRRLDRIIVAERDEEAVRLPVPIRQLDERVGVAILEERPLVVVEVVPVGDRSDGIRGFRLP